MRRIARVTVIIEVELEPSPVSQPARRRPSGKLTERVLGAVRTLIAQSEIPSPINIARLLDVNPSAITPSLRALVGNGTLYKGDKVGRHQPYYPAGQET